MKKLLSKLTQFYWKRKLNSREQLNKKLWICSFCEKREENRCSETGKLLKEQVKYYCPIGKFKQ